MRTHRPNAHAWVAFKPGQVAKDGELANGYSQTLGQSSARDLTKCETERERLASAQASALDF